MAEIKLWMTVHIVLIINVLSIRGSLLCDSNNTAVTCSATNNNEVLRRGPVSDKNGIILIKMKWCNIIEVDVDAFKNNPRVKQIDLSHNKISALKVGMFNGVTTLIYLKLSNNWLTGLPVDIFAQLSNLKVLDLSYNHIVSFGIGIFNPLPDLISLDLSNNRFLGKDLYPHIFAHNPNLQSIDFSRNDMSGSPLNILLALDALEILELVACLRNEVPQFVTYPTLRNIKKLKLISNQIKRIDDPMTFNKMVNLKSLDLSLNSIEILNVSVLTSLRNLYYLGLSYNNIKKIPEDLFKNVPSLGILDLSYNFIELVPGSGFLHKSELKALSLVGNRIKFLDSNFFSNLKLFGSSLAKFYFDDNPIQCPCLLDILKELKMYNIKYNSNNYDGKHAVCEISGRFTCIRDIHVVCTSSALQDLELLYT